MEAWIEQILIPPGIYRVPRRIDLYYWRSQAPGVQIRLQHVLPVEEEDVVLGIHTNSAQASDDPSVGQGLGPRRIDLIPGRATRRPRGKRLEDRGRDRQDSACAHFERKVGFHIRVLLRSPIQSAD